MREVRPSLGDVLLIVVAMVVTALTVVNLWLLVEAVFEADDLTAPLWTLAVNVPIATVLWTWIAWGAWRRTVWGCVLEPIDGNCERHGRRCRQRAWTNA